MTCNRTSLAFGTGFSGLPLFFQLADVGREILHRFFGGNHGFFIDGQSGFGFGQFGFGLGFFLGPERIALTRFNCGIKRLQFIAPLSSLFLVQCTHTGFGSAKR